MSAGNLQPGQEKELWYATRGEKYLGRLAAFVLLYIFWITLSGKFDLFHLSLGGLCSLLVAFLSHDLLFTNIKAEKRHLSSVRFIVYLFWLIYQVIMANFHVAYLVLSPKMPIEPRMVKFKTTLTGDISTVTLANSITLTPGTITVDIIDGKFYVHAVSKKTGDQLLTGKMEQRVAHVFSEGDAAKR